MIKLQCLNSEIFFSISFKFSKLKLKMYNCICFVLMQNMPKWMNYFISSLFQTNVTSVFNVCRLSAELMAKNSPDSNGQRGVIINKSHRLAFNSSLAPYSMSQAAIIGMTLPMARDFKDLGVRVNSIATGESYSLAKGLPTVNPHGSQTCLDLCKSRVYDPFFM